MHESRSLVRGQLRSRWADVRALLHAAPGADVFFGARRSLPTSGPLGVPVPQRSLVADPQRLVQALTQLAANAVAHTDPGAAITIGGAAAGDEVYLWVLDAGPGVPVGDRARIFERFARSRATRRRGEGSGLGLSIVSAIARAHGGRVDLLSTEEVGSAFVLVLRVGAEAAAGRAGVTGS